MKAADEEVRTEKVRLDFIPNVSKFLQKLRLMKVLNEEGIFSRMYAAIYAAMKGHKHVLSELL